MSYKKTLFAPLGLLALSAAGTSLCALEYELDAPKLQTTADIMYCTTGLRMHIRDDAFAYGQVEILANAMRWDQKRNVLFMSGDITVLSQSYTLRADHIGFDVGQQTGEAWNVHISIRDGKNRTRISCERILISPKEFTLFGVKTDNGHGSMFNVRSSRIRVRRADTAHPHRSGLTANIDDITINNPRLQAGAVPFFWLPIVYRDYRLDYPWTHVEFGHESDRGAFVRAWIGVDLPRMGDMSSMIRLRNDHYELSGRGLGVEYDWKSNTLGTGNLYHFKMDPEILYSDTNGGFPDLDDLAFNNLYDKMHGTRVTRRTAEAMEFEHLAKIPHGALYLRWSDLPQSITGALDHDKFRADYLETQMQENPMARQGLSAAWSSPLVDIAYDRALQPFEDSRLADKEHGLHLSVTPLQLFDNIHLESDLWLEQFRIEDAGITGEPLSEAWRLHGAIALRSSSWFSEWGYDSRLGIEVLRYEDSTINDLAQDDAQSSMLIAEFGIKTRLVAQFASGLRHKFSPRLGFEFATEANGDDLPTLDVDDDRESLDDDLQLITVSLDNTLSKAHRSIRMYNKFRFGTRDIDRRYYDENGDEQEGPNSLVDVENTVNGKLSSNISINAEFDYNGLIEDWSKFDVSLNWLINERVRFSWQSNLVPESSNEAAYWQHEPHVYLKANRYSIDFATTHRDRGNSIDGFQINLTRTMIDGQMLIGYDEERDQNGDVIDKRVNFSIALGAWGGM